MSSFKTQGHEERQKFLEHRALSTMRRGGRRREDEEKKGEEREKGETRREEERRRGMTPQARARSEAAKGDGGDGTERLGSARPRGTRAERTPRSGSWESGCRVVREPK